MKTFYTVLLPLFFLFNKTIAQPTIGFQPLITGLSVPVDIVAPGDGRLFIVEQNGKIKVWNGNSVLATPFLDASAITTYDVGGERGLLSMAFHPNYATNRYFFIYYNNAAGNVTLARYQTKVALPNEADPTTGVVLMSIPKPFTNHNGGKLNFGTDGYLYFGTGDGGSSGDPNNNAQTGTSNLGKMMRIDVNNFSTAPYYSIPPTNPYITDPNINDEIIAVGLRNPWRWSFDRLTGDMWIGDVGQNLWEEVNYRPAASITNLNYGWRCFEGTHVYNNTCSAQPNNVVPIFDYAHNNATGGYSITGGYVYRGAEYPFFQGYYLFADYVSKNFWLTKSNGAGGWITTQATNQTPVSISSFGEDQNGNLYAAGLSNGTIYKVTATAAVPLKLVSFTAKKINNNHQLDWEVNTQLKGDKFIVERSFDNFSFVEVGNKIADADKNMEQYSFLIPSINNAINFYRLKLVNKDGSITYSSIVGIKEKDDLLKIKAYKSGSRIMVSFNNAIKSIQISDGSGRILCNRNINAAGEFGFDGNQFSKGILIIKVLHENGMSVLKVMN